MVGAILFEPNIRRVFKSWINSWETLYKKRSFVHWYVAEGTDEGIFYEAIENMKGISGDLRDFGEREEACEEEEDDYWSRMS